MTIAPSRPSAAQAALSDRLQDPAVLGALVDLLDHAELVAVLVEGLDGFVARSETIGDSLVDGVTELRKVVGSDETLTGAGVDVGALLRACLQVAAVVPSAAPGLVAAVESGAVDKLLASGVLGADAVDQVAIIAQGLVGGSHDFRTDPVRVSGPLSLVRLLKDPDINRAISFFATVARSIGREIAAADVPANQPAPNQHAPNQ